MCDILRDLKTGIDVWKLFDLHIFYLNDMGLYNNGLELKRLQPTFFFYMFIEKTTDI